MGFDSCPLASPAEKCIQNIYQEFCLGKPRKYSGIMAELLLQEEMSLDSIKANITEFTAGGVDTVSVGPHPRSGPVSSGPDAGPRGPLLKLQPGLCPGLHGMGQGPIHTPRKGCHGSPGCTARVHGGIVWSDTRLHVLQGCGPKFWSLLLCHVSRIPSAPQTTTRHEMLPTRHFQLWDSVSYGLKTHNSESPLSSYYLLLLIYCMEGCLPTC